MKNSQNLINDLKEKLNANWIEDLKSKVYKFLVPEGAEGDLKKKTELEVVLNTDDKPMRRIGFTILFVMIGIFGTWSFVAPIDSSALATGTVVVKSHRKTIQHLEGGIVDKISVRDGDLVDVGDILLTLDDTQVTAQIKILQGQFISASAISSRLNAERILAKEISFSTDLKQLNDSRVQETTAGQTQIFLARRNSLQGELSILKQRIDQLSLKIKGLKTQQESNHQLLSLYAEEIKDLKELLADGFADKQRLRDLQRQHTQTNSDIAALITEIASTQMQQGETKLQILQTKREFQEEVATQLEEVNSELFSISEQLIVAKDQNQRSTIIAPVKGMIIGMATHTTGGVIGPGQVILGIVPEGEELVINAQVAPLDIDRIQIGTAAEVRFSAFNSKTTPVMEGRVQTISADSLLDEVTGMQYYQASIELTPESHERLGGLVLIPGMPAEVLINTGKRTFFEYLVQPLTNAFARSFIEE
ncbi:MAG: HlyD family type I secretion periplasmic adaptor subunit [Methyloprofundus sp.]|nr:HlyD family type I secretion periplasmic adaptor subunit [Methyloprofundus sp.]